MKKDNKLTFETYENASEWFDKIDLSYYKDQLIPTDFSFDLRKNRDLVELDREIAKTVRRLARKQNIPTRKLVNKLLKEGIEGRL
jgi:hypothetical protein